VPVNEEAPARRSAIYPVSLKIVSSAAHAVLLRSSRNGRVLPRPFLKWVGGKTQLLDELSARVPANIQRYFEPFVGGGALYFHKRPKQCVLADLNSELMNCWSSIRDDVSALIEDLGRHYYDKDYFYSVRAQDPSQLTAVQAASRTIFLNRTGFNGLYRVNKKGGFNVPFGRYSNPLICDEENLQACSAALQTVQFRTAPFAAVVEEVGQGDFVYLDPPYVPLSRTANFTGYVAGGFGPHDQQQLAQALVGIHRRGGRFMLSNADTPGTRAMYRALPIESLKIEQVQASRSVNCRSSGRGKVGELIVRNN
jgi:DNA adenine methylase